MGPKLVLYSDGVIPENAPIDRRMMALIGKPDPTVAFICSSEDPEGFWFRGKAEQYAALGARMDLSFGLDDDYDPSILPNLLSCDAIHLSGGNTYGFLHRLRRRGMVDILRDYVMKGGVLVGTSAGAILMTSDISSSALCGDENLVGLEDFSGLGLVDFLFWPHYEGGTVAADRTLYACPDGAGIVVDGESVELFGAVRTL